MPFQTEALIVLVLEVVLVNAVLCSFLMERSFGSVL